MKSLFLLFVPIVLTCCSTATKVPGWYPVADYPDDRVTGDAVVTVKDFKHISIDSIDSHVYIAGKLKPAKIAEWADYSETHIGKRLGFLYNDSIVCAPTINTRLESGNFQITSPDAALLHKIYDSLSKEVVAD